MPYNVCIECRFVTGSYIIHVYIHKLKADLRERLHKQQWVVVCVFRYIQDLRTQVMIQGINREEKNMCLQLKTDYLPIVVFSEVIVIKYKFT